MVRLLFKLSALLRGIASLAVAGYIVSRLLVFKQIFFEHAGISITQPQVAAAYGGANETRPQLIPKIIHQVFHNWRGPGNETLPSDWDHVRKTCIDKNTDWEYRLWTEKTSRDFIELNYPWFLGTYDRYRYPVQRVDAVRYFLLMHYGGIYLDLDNGCKENLTPLLYYPMWVTDPGRGALSNNILASSPHHPFWTRITQSLIPWDYNWFFPYVTISYASGQWFVSGIWQEYHSLLPPVSKNPEIEHRQYRLMMDDRDGADLSTYFTQERGGTWINWDNYLFLVIGDHLFLFFMILTAGLASTTWCCLRVQRRLRNSKASGYSRLGSTMRV